MTQDGKYAIEKIIGKGSFGTVAKAYDFLRQRHVAIKRLTNFSKNEYQTLQILREVKIMKALNSVSDGKKHVPIIYDVIESYDSCDDFNGGQQTLSIFIIMEYFYSDF